jgi:hypothetical protein
LRVCGAQAPGGRVKKYAELVSLYGALMSHRS